MKSCTYLKKLFLFICIGLLSTSALAKEVTMYDQPTATAKAVGKADLAAGIIPIFTPKTGDWIKIADPRNGNVGWIKSSDMNGPHNSFSFTQRIISNDKSGVKSPVTYQMMYGEPAKFSVEQLQTLQKLQGEQQLMEKSMQKLVQDMVKNVNNMYQLAPTGVGSTMLVPVILVPAPVNTSTLK